MPAQKPVDRVIKLVAGGSYQNQPWVNVFHVQYSAGPIGSADIKSLCNSVFSIYSTTLLQTCIPLTTLSTVRGVDLSAPDAPQAASDQPTVTGTLGGNPLPCNVAACMSWLVNYRWRGGHFRTYVPAGSTTSMQNGNSWTSAALTAFRSEANEFYTSVSGLTIASAAIDLVGVRRWNTPVKGQPPVELDPPLVLPITGVVVDSRIDSQRRRLGRDVSA